jgi:hypothetical protein
MSTKPSTCSCLVNETKDKITIHIKQILLKCGKFEISGNDSNRSKLHAPGNDEKIKFR